MIEVQIKYFGAFRNSKRRVELSKLRFEKPFKVSELKSKLASEFRNRMGDESTARLVLDSAVASEDEILPLDLRVERNCTLLLLPPVCGG